MKQKYREFTPGSTVKVTGNHLISTGQRVGREGSKRWTVLSCSCSLCKSGRFVAVDEPSTTEWARDELEKEPGLVYRHFNKEALSIVGQLDIRNCGDVYVGVTMDGLIKGHTKEGTSPIESIKQPTVKKVSVSLDMNDI